MLVSPPTNINLTLAKDANPRRVIPLVGEDCFTGFIITGLYLSIGIMKIKIIKNVWVDYQDNLDYNPGDKYFREGDIIEAVNISRCGKYANIILENYTLLDVPVNAFEELPPFQSQPTQTLF